MKKISLLMVLVMLMTCVTFTASMEGENVIKESASGFYYIEAEGNRPRLSSASADKFMQVDGEWFKDMNGNKSLDAYEDWRLTSDERVADLLSKMTDEEKAGTLIFSCVFGKNGNVVSNLNADLEVHTDSSSGIPYVDDPETCLYSHNPVEVVSSVNVSPMGWQIQDMGVTTFIAALTGTPKDQLDLFNKMQAIAEDTRLGIPAVFSGDRSYNTWGGMIDMAHYAFGVTHDPELLYDLVSEYAKESVALGYQQVFHGYGNEIGSWYGDTPSYIALMAATETKAYEDNGFNSHSKHFIARGGRNAYVSALSPADLIDSWKIGWKAVVDAGTQWVMTNNNVGVTPGLQGYMDKDTYTILRDELGYNGIVCLDWPLDISALMEKTGITSDGVDVSTLSATERYALILNAGVDMFSAIGVMDGTDISVYSDVGFRRAFPDLIVDAKNQNLITAEDLDVHVGRVLKNKISLKLFEDPYRDWNEALEVIGSDAYKAEQFVPMNNEEINTARRSEVTAMEEQVMIESTILLKNENILPLTKGVKIYADSNNGNIKEADHEALSAYGTLVETIEEADIVIAHVTAFDDAYDYIVEDAQAAGKPIVLIFEGTVGRNGAQAEPYLAQVAPSAAVLMQTYNNTPDHGSSVGSFYRYVTPSVTAQMLFGEKEPAGSTVFEIPVDTSDIAASWGELQVDMGVDAKTRLYMAMTAKENPAVEMPNNLGDVLYTTNFGMNYSTPASIELSLLTVPQDADMLMVENNGRTSITKVVNNTVQKAGVPFEIDLVAKNNGGDGHMTVTVMDGENVAAEKFVALDAGQFRVISIEITLEAGEHVLTVGDMTATITVE